MAQKDGAVSSKPNHGLVSASNYACLHEIMPLPRTTPQHVSAVVSETTSANLNHSCACPLSLEIYFRRRLRPGHSGLRFDMRS